MSPAHPVSNHLSRSSDQSNISLAWPDFALMIFLILFCTQSIAQTDTDQQSEAPALKSFDWVDTSSPRATLKSFLLGTDRYRELIRDNGFTEHNWRELSNIGKQAERLFDLQEVPKGFRSDVTLEIMVLIREVLARVGVPNPEEIPDEDTMTERIADGKSSVYRLTATPFEIARTESGPYQGRYQFTIDTVVHAREFFEEIKSYPIIKGQERSSGFYDAFFLSPGPGIPHSWVTILPAWTKREIMRQNLWQWSFLVLAAILYAAAIAATYLLVNRICSAWSPLCRNLMLLTRPIAVIVLAILVEKFLIKDVRLTDEVARSVGFGKHLAIIFGSISITLGLGNVLAELIVSAKHFERRQFDKQIIRLSLRIIGVVAAVAIFIEEMQEVGFSFATLLAGAGVSGLAVALAAQDTLKNIFGGIALALDRPFIIGERVKLKDYDGTIQSVGLRSTRIHALNGNYISIPNEEVAKCDVQNITRRPYIYRRFSIALTYDTSPEKICRAMEIIKEILSIPEKSSSFAEDYEPAHPNESINHSDFPPRVYFRDLNTYSLDLLICYWFHPADYWMYLEHATWVNTQILERFNSEGINFAFPTQTLQLAGENIPPSTFL